MRKWDQAEPYQARKSNGKFVYPLHTKQCECGKSFTTRRQDKFYCSRKCNNNAVKRRSRHAEHVRKATIIEATKKELGLE